MGNHYLHKVGLHLVRFLALILLNSSNWKNRWFDGQDIHGTVSPTRAALENASKKTPYSDGLVIVLREKDANAAKELQRATMNIPKLTKYWLE